MMKYKTFGFKKNSDYSFEILANKQYHKPARKHGSIPL
jgi:hypothetical protein